MRSTYRFHENVNHLFEYGVDAAGILSPLGESASIANSRRNLYTPRIWSYRCDRARYPAHLAKGSSAFASRRRLR